MAERRWTKLSSKEVYRNGNFFSVHEDQVLGPDGQEYAYGVIKGNGAVYIVARSDDGRYLLVEQHRYPVDRNVVEIIAGNVELGDDPLVTAEHELSEEANVGAKHLELLGTLLPAPARQQFTIYAVLATGVDVSELGHIQQDGNEAINRVWAATEDELIELIKTDRLVDVTTLAVLNLYWIKYGFPSS